MSSSRREIVLGVGGGIAAYKSADLLRRLQDHGFRISVVPTPASLNFVGTATWEALSGREVASQVWENVPNVPHIGLAENADLILVAPATADLIARVAHGRADDLLTNVILATTAPIIFVPAMHPHMWQNPATVENVATLRKRGYRVVEPDFGRLTGSDVGVGRFPETSRIVQEVEEVTGSFADLIGKRVLVTAGGTREPIDPVRFIGNRSSGKQGFAIAQAALSRGATVTLIAANCEGLTCEGAEIVRVETTSEMEKVLQESFGECDLLVMCAAVADARPSHVEEGKLKKGSLQNISLAENPDLLAGVAERKRDGQFLIGFAAETTDLLANATEKLARKKLDIVYVNDVSGGAIFGSDFTGGTIISKDGAILEVTDATKDTLADVLLDQYVFRLDFRLG